MFPQFFTSLLSDVDGLFFSSGDFGCKNGIKYLYIAVINETYILSKIESIHSSEHSPSSE